MSNDAKNSIPPGNTRGSPLCPHPHRQEMAYAWTAAAQTDQTDESGELVGHHPSISDPAHDGGS